MHSVRLENLFDVIIDGVHTAIQFVGDLLVEVSLDQQIEDHRLGRSQRKWRVGVDPAQTAGIARHLFGILPLQTTGIMRQQQQDTPELNQLAGKHRSTVNSFPIDKGSVATVQIGDDHPLLSDAEPRMPLKAKPLDDFTIKTLETWVTQGAKFDGPSEVDTT